MTTEVFICLILTAIAQTAPAKRLLPATAQRSGRVLMTEPVRKYCLPKQVLGSKQSEGQKIFFRFFCILNCNFYFSKILS